MSVRSKITEETQINRVLPLTDSLDLDAFLPIVVAPTIGVPLPSFFLVHPNYGEMF